jgi:isopenicillin N synthase-like dioxygenase
MSARPKQDTSSIPLLDVRDFLDGEPAALKPLAEQLHIALRDVGFYFLRGHGVPTQLVDSVFAASKQFHEQPLQRKMAIRANEHNVGYMPVNGYVSKSSRISTSNKPNLVEALFVKRDLDSDHPDVIANKRFRPMNQWPGELTKFRETVVAYCNAMEKLCLRLLPVYASAFELGPGYFDLAFAEPQYTLRMSHYPPSETGDADQFGVAAHTDSSFLTMLAQSELPGLAIRAPHGDWIDAPVIDGAFLVNSGDMLRRWTNDKFLSTPHRVVNRTPGRDRYAIPFFFDASADYPMSCLPSCCNASNQARYEPTTYTEYMLWFSRQYDHVREMDPEAPANPGIPS